MDVVRHDDEFVKMKDAALAISEQSVEKRVCGAIRTGIRERRPQVTEVTKNVRSAKLSTAAEAASFFRLFSHGSKPCASTVLPAACTPGTNRDRLSRIKGGGDVMSIT